MKVLVVKPCKEPEVVEITNSLEEMQRIVGGYIETFPTFQNDEAIIICNEEGKNMNLPLNRAIYSDGELVDIIAGDFIICSDKGFEFAGLPEDLIIKYQKLFAVSSII